MEIAGHGLESHTHNALPKPIALPFFLKKKGEVAGYKQLLLLLILQNTKSNLIIKLSDYKSSNKENSILNQSGLKIQFLIFDKARLYW